MLNVMFKHVVFYITGLDINPAIRGLASLGRFIEMITVADKNMQFQMP